MDLRKWSVFSLLNADFLNKIKIASVFGDAGNEVLVVTVDDKVYGFGPNSSGSLGFEHQHGSMEPKIVTALCDKRIKGFASGSGPHVVAFTETGEVFSWGHNGFYELGRGKTGNNNQVLSLTVLSVVLADKKIIEVACGKHHTLILSDSGEVFAWGQNSYGQVGPTNVSGNQTNQGCSTPQRLYAGLNGKFVVKIACGQTSSFAVLDTGEVYSWGYNGAGLLGLGNNTDQSTPSKIISLSGVVIVKIACGHSHALALSDEGVLYGWGANGYGQLGTGDKTNANVPIKICDKVGRITNIAAIHYSHISAVLTENFQVYMWGQCKGQSVTEPTLTPFNSLHEVFANFSNPAVSYKPMKSIYDGETVVETIAKSFDNPECSDLTIMVQDKPIRVHKSILKLRCQYFRTMFQDHWQENKQSVLHIDKSTYPVYRAFLQYLYTDSVNLSPEEALELLDLAESYCELPLKHLCEQIIRHGITVDNAASLYATAVSLQAKDLEKSCLFFALNHMTAVIQSVGFSELDEKIMKNFVIEASKHGAFKT